MMARTSNNDGIFWIAVIIGLLLLGNGIDFGSTVEGPVDPDVAMGELPDLTSVPDGAELPGYEREAFGTAWKDVDRNGCDTRNDILKRDLENIVFRTGSNCVVQSGVLEDPYTGQRMVWTKGDSPGIDIDHMVPLKRAWDMGASTWSDERREQYANDPFVLIAVNGSANRSKSDQGPGEWMPSNTDYHCAYATHYIAVSAKYQLTISASDRKALTAAMKRC